MTARATVQPGHTAPRAKALLLFVLPLLASTARGQIFNISAGASDLYGSEGLTLRTEEPGFRTLASVGYDDGVKLGGAAEKDLGSYTLRAGDSTIPFLLPTDIFDHSHVLLRRGFGASFHAPAPGSTSWDAFAGGGAANSINPYLSYATIDHALGMLFLRHTFTPHLQASSYLISLGQTTAIQALDWRPRTDLAVGLSLGVGSDHPFGAASFDAHHPNWTAQASYTGQDGMFHRLSIDPTEGSEIVGLNAELARHWKYLRLDLARHEYQSIAEFADPATRGQVTEAGIGTTLAGVQVDGRIFRTTAPGIDRQTVSVSGGRSYRALRSTLMYYTASQNSPAQASAASVPGEHALVATEYVRAARRLELNSNITIQQGSRALAFGGTLTSNALDLSLGQQTYFIPFAAGSQMQQVWTVSLRLHAFGNTTLALDNQLGADDKVHYTAYAGDYLYRDGAVWHTSSAASSFKVTGYSITGCLRTPAGDPVAGGALTILPIGAKGTRRQDELFTDIRGCFSWSTAHPGAFTLSLKPSDFLTPNRYAASTPPAEVTLSAAAPSATVALTAAPLPNDTP